MLQTARPIILESQRRYSRIIQTDFHRYEQTAWVKQRTVPSSSGCKTTMTARTSKAPRQLAERSSKHMTQGRQAPGSVDHMLLRSTPRNAQLTAPHHATRATTHEFVSGAAGAIFQTVKHCF